jgi:hypothetical protein
MMPTWPKKWTGFEIDPPFPLSFQVKELEGALEKHMGREGY